MTCRKCLKPCYDWYKVHDEVWALSGLGAKDGFLHLRCLEVSIGRKLTITDFTENKINYAIKFGYSLKQEESQSTETCTGAQGQEPECLV